MTDTVGGWLQGKKRGRSAATTSTTPAPEPGAAGGSEVTAEGTGDAGGDGGGEAGSDEAAASLESDPKRPRTRKQPEVEVLSVRAETVSGGACWHCGRRSSMAHPLPTVWTHPPPLPLMEQEKLKPGAINLPLPFALKKVLVDDWEVRGLGVWFVASRCALLLAPPCSHTHWLGACGAAFTECGPKGQAGGPQWLTHTHCCFSPQRVSMLAPHAAPTRTSLLVV